jgi:hypothetical protein
MTAAEAQKAALDVLARVRQGGDPAREKRAERRALTVETLADQFLVDHVSKRKPATREAYAVALAKLKAEHGSLKAEQLTRSHVSALHHGLKETPYAANKLLGACPSSCGIFGTNLIRLRHEPTFSSLDN